MQKNVLSFQMTKLVLPPQTTLDFSLEVLIVIKNEQPEDLRNFYTASSCASLEMT